MSTSCCSSYEIDPRSFDPRLRIGEFGSLAEAFQVVEKGLDDPARGGRACGGQESRELKVECAAEAAIRPEVEAALERRDRDR